METIEIEVPDNKGKLVKELLKELGIKIKVKKDNKRPNAETILAMKELKAGSGIKFNSVEDLFNSI